MFYLFENNRIIDSEISYTTNFPYWEIKDNCLFAKSKNDKLVRPCTENKIKKQSEYVYYLIEWENDLVKTKDGDIISCKNLYIFYMQEYIKNQFFTAIYKPNANGDYIKVWEREEE